MIYVSDFIKSFIDSTRYRTKYRCSCDKCGVDRGYQSKQNAVKPFCRKCTNRSTKESRLKMSAAKKGKIPWNKGRKENRSEVRAKISKGMQGRKPYNKGQKMSLLQKIKLSCSQRKINISDFDELQTPIMRAERNRFYDMMLHIKCFELSNFTCSCCKATNTALNAHHMNSWKFFPNERFNLDNLVSLCEECHDEFHDVYGNGKSSANTKEQYEAFVKAKQTKTPLKA